MRVGSLFSGMEGFGLGFENAGMTLSWWVEKDKNCQKILRRKYPDAKGITDVQEATAEKLEPVDLISFGWPCQDLSVAGLREGLAGSRSGLFYEAMRIIKALSPEWIVGENVPGLLSSGERRDMGAVVRFMEELGYCISWAMLDTQYFHLAQRRERLFFVGSLGNTGSIKVLFESDCGPWNTAPSREKGEAVAGTIGGGSETSRRGWRNDLDTQGAYVPCIKGAAIGRKPEAGPQYGEILEDGSCYTLNCIEDHAVVGAIACNAGPRGHDAGNFHCNQAVDAGHIIPVPDPAFALNAHGGTGRIDGESETVIAIQDCREMEKKQNGIGINKDGIAYTVDGTGAQGIAFAQNCYVAQVYENHGQDSRIKKFEVCPQLNQKSGTGGNNLPLVAKAMLVRRLTPTEYLRLQGFPDDYLDGLDLSDSAKYRMIGNSVSPKITFWIGKRIMEALNA